MRLNRVVFGVLAISLAIGVSGCGVIFGGTKEDVRLTSSPDAARVEVGDERRVYTTPASLQLERKNSYFLTFTKDGYEERTYELERKLRGGILALDILFTGLIGVVIDAATGGWYKLEPKNLDVSLTRVADRADGPEEIHVRAHEENGRLKVESSVPVRVQIEARD